MRIVIFNGPPGSGKDTCCEIISKGTQVRHFSLASPLKRATHCLHGFFSAPETLFLGEDKEQPQEMMGGMVPRQAYIDVSEKMVKEVWGKDFFAKALVRRLNDNPANELITLSDGGFQCEIAVLSEAYGAENIQIVHLVREGCSFEKDSREYLAATEGMPPIISIDNNGSMKDLADRVEQPYKWIMGEKV